eukprot:14310172-Alexandrium_andersonii.AAC.1
MSAHVRMRVPTCVRVRVCALGCVCDWASRLVVKGWEVEWRLVDRRENREAHEVACSAHRLHGR